MKILAIVVIILAIGLFGALVQFGLFSRIKIGEKIVGPYLLIYSKFVGDYKNTAPVMDALYADLKDNFGVDSTKGFGLYYDKPGDVEAAKLRSIVGIIVEGKTISELDAVKEKYGVVEFPATLSVTTEFPYKGLLSILLGVFRVYPKMAAYIAEHNLPQTPQMEIYDQPAGKMYYHAPYAMQQGVFESYLE